MKNIPDVPINGVLVETIWCVETDADIVNIITKIRNIANNEENSTPQNDFMDTPIFRKQPFLSPLLV